MSAHAELMKVVQDIANGCYHADRERAGQYHNPEFNYHVNQIAMRIHEPLAAVLWELVSRFDQLGELEAERTEPTAESRVRAFVWSLAASEITTFIEDRFTFKPIETRAPEEAAQFPEMETAQEIFDAVVRMRDAGQLHPDYVFDYDRGILRGVSKRVQTTPVDSAHVRWDVGTSAPEDALTRERRAFGERVYDARKRAGITRKKLARKIGETTYVVRLIEYGDLRDVSINEPLRRNSYIVEQIASALGSTVDILWPSAAGNEKNASR